MIPSGAALAITFGLGCAVGTVERIGQGWGGHNMLWRLRTTSGRWAIKQAPGRTRPNGEPALGRGGENLAIIRAVIDAVIFDLDGVLLDSEQLWDRARRDVARDHGGHWVAEATAAMQGMSSVEWARYMQHALGVQLSQDAVVDLVVERLMASYDESGLPLLPGALEAVSRLAQRWPLGLASSSNRVVIDKVLDVAGIRDRFEVTVSSEEVAHGKPAPDVYLEAARRLGCAPSSCVAVEDSANGIRAGVAAAMRVVAVPNREFRPADEILAMSDLVLESLDELTVERVEGLDKQAAADERLDEEEVESFPASDPHADWAGRPT